MNYDQFISFIEIACGIYCIVSAIKMKQTGEINTTLLMSKDNAYKKCKDKAKFLSLVIPRVAILGIMILISGAINMWFDTHGGANAIVFWGVTAVLLGSLIWYSMSIRKIVDKFF